MTTPHPSGLRAGDRVRWRAVGADDVLARLGPGETPAYPVELDGVLVEHPSGEWARVQYDGDPFRGDTRPAAVMVESLTRLDES